MPHSRTQSCSDVISDVAALAALFVGVLLAPGGGPAAAYTASGEPLKVAFFGFELINTSPEPTSDAERARLASLGEQLRGMLEASGRYRVVPLSGELRKKIAAGAEITGCNGCQIDWAREAGADLAVWGTVQKVSNLILNITVSMYSVKDGRRYSGRSVDIRGNTDESWQRGILYLVQHYLFNEE
jgi:hypothetical protein